MLRLSVAGPPRTVHLLNNSEQPATVFSILESGQKQVPLVSDPLFMDLMKKLASVYTCKQQTRMEAKGPRFEVNDFLVKLGTVTMNANFKGVLVEASFTTTTISELSAIAFVILIALKLYIACNLNAHDFQVEYRPCVVPASCWELLREFMQGFLGNCVPNQAPAYLQVFSHDCFSKFYLNIF